MTTATWPDILGSLPPFYNNPTRACADMPTETFFPTGAGDHGEKAKAVCRRCPLRQDCFDYAVNQPDLHGIWAGTTARDRQRHRRLGWATTSLLAAGTRGARRKAAARRSRIVALSARGYTAAQVADRVGCSPRTVDRHLAIARREAA